MASLLAAIPAFFSSAATTTAAAAPQLAAAGTTITATGGAVAAPTAVGMSLGTKLLLGSVPFSLLSEINTAITHSKIAEAEAKSAKIMTAMEEERYRRESAYVISKGEAIAAASGLDPGSGSVLLSILDNVKTAEIEAQTIRKRGEIISTGKKFESQLAKRSIPGAFAKAGFKTGSILAEFLKT